MKTTYTHRPGSNDTWDVYRETLEEDGEPVEEWVATVATETAATTVIAAFANKKSRLAIHLDGGLVEAVVTDTPGLDIEIAVFDYDTDGCGEDEITPIPQGDGTSVNAFVRGEQLGQAKIDLNAVFKAAYCEEDASSGTVFGR